MDYHHKFTFIDEDNQDHINLLIEQLVCQLHLTHAEAGTIKRLIKSDDVQAQEIAQKAQELSMYSQNLQETAYVLAGYIIKVMKDVMKQHYTQKT